MKNGIENKHYTFSIDRLKLYNKSHDKTNIEANLTDTNELLVEQIINHHGDIKYKKQLKFLVKWYGINTPTWQDYKDLKNNIQCGNYLDNLSNKNKKQKLN